MNIDNMMAALIHWRIRPEEEHITAFLDHWKTNNTIGDRTGLIAEFLSDSLKISDFPYITWHLDPESFGDFRSFVTIGFWQHADHFRDQVEAYFNDDKPLLPFEKYRRRRVVFKPIAWRVGGAPLPNYDSSGVD